MKKSLYAALLLLLFVGSFVAGPWPDSRKAEGGDFSGAEPAAVDPEDKADAETDAGSDRDAETDIDISSMPPGTVRINYPKQQLIGVRTGVVEKVAVTKMLRIPGRVAPDEDRVFDVKAALDGIIEKVFPSTTGSMVKEGQPLAIYYSPDIYAAQQGYLIALSSDRWRNNLQVQVNESRLEFLGMSQSQVKELKKKQEIEETITLTAPGTGFVFSREVSPGLRFQKGERLYRIVDLTQVWIYADIYESEARYIQPRATVKVSHPQLGKEFKARVSDVLPLFDADTRTLKVRLEVDNPEFLLRPDMFVDIELPVSFPPAITVPAAAVLDSGLKKTVFIDRGNGLLEPREVETGWRFDDRVEITKGLKPGERIIVSGTFLIDSESRLEMAAAGMYGTLSKDPVCGLDVSMSKAEKAGRKTIYKGNTYYFSSEECKAKFEEDPDRYLTDQ